MKVFIDCEFHERQVSSGIFTKSKSQQIDLISVGLVKENGESLYLISNEFNLEAAWDSFQMDYFGNKEYWLKNNALQPIFREYQHSGATPFNQKEMRNVLNFKGLSLSEIKLEIIEFFREDKIELYGYYPSYDFVCFCSIFGRMLDLPKNVSWVISDLKTLLDLKVDSLGPKDFLEYFHAPIKEITLKDKLRVIKRREDYPHAVNAHNALADAQWNKALYEFINKL